MSNFIKEPTPEQEEKLANGNHHKNFFKPLTEEEVAQSEEDRLAAEEAKLTAEREEFERMKSKAVKADDEFKETSVKKPAKGNKKK